MEELNICKLFILLTQPPTQPAYQPKSEKCAYLWHFSTDPVEIWYGVSKWKDYSSYQTSLPPNQPTSLKVKNVYNYTIFQPIYLKLGMETQNGRT